MAQSVYTQERISLMFNSDYLKECIAREEGSFNKAYEKASKVIGISKRRFMELLVAGDKDKHIGKMLADSLNTLIDHYNMDVWKLFNSDNDEENLVVQHIVNEKTNTDIVIDVIDYLLLRPIAKDDESKGYEPFTDHREWDDIDCRDYALIELLKAHGYILEPMKDGTSCYTGNEISSGSVPNTETYELFQKIHQFIESEMKEFDHRQFIKWTKEGIHMVFDPETYEVKSDGHVVYKKNIDK